MELQIEATPTTMKIRSTEQLANLRSQYQTQTMVWTEEVMNDAYVYTVSQDEWILFFAYEKAVSASIVFDQDEELVELAVNDANLVFGDNLDLPVNDNIVSMYVSLKSTLRIGWNWFGTTEALVEERRIKHYEMTDAGLLVDVSIRTKFFAPTALEANVVGTLLPTPLVYTIKNLTTTKNGMDGYDTHGQILVPNTDIAAMHAQIVPHQTKLETFELKFKLQIDQARLSKDTMKWTADKDMVLANPLLKLTTSTSEDLVLATRVSGAGNVMFVPLILDHGEFEAARQQLLDTDLTIERTKIVLLDQGMTREQRQNTRLLFTHMMTLNRKDVFLLTDGQFEDDVIDSSNEQIVFANSKAHVGLYPQIKKLVVTGNRHDALPFGAQAVIPMSIKHHVFLIDDLVDQIETQGFNFPVHGQLDFLVANRQNRKLVTHAAGKHAKVHVTGLPQYATYERESPSVPAEGIGFVLSELDMTVFEDITTNMVKKEISENANFRAYNLIVTDQYQVAVKASSLQVPVLYINQELTFETVDRFYRLAGPVVRDVKSGMPIISKVFQQTFDFNPYVTRANENLNGVHRATVCERIAKFL